MAVLTDLLVLALSASCVAIGAVAFIDAAVRVVRR